MLFIYRNLKISHENFINVETNSVTSNNAKRQHKSSFTIKYQGNHSGMILMFILVHIGFYVTYIKHFPAFEGYNWLHHIHGSLMGSWLFLLVLQPILIHKRKFAAHRFIGKLSYIIVPVIVVSMLLIARYNYQTGILENTSKEIFARQINTWMQIFMFVLFYSLAIFYRQDTTKHMRFMIATAIVMIGPAMSRIILHFWGDTSVPYFAILPLYLKTVLAVS